MKILVDRDGMSRLRFGWETSDYRVHYVADPPARAIVAFHNGLDPKALTGAVVDTENGEGIGLAGRVRSATVGKLHTMIMVTQRVNGPPDGTLSQMLDAGRQDGD
jgi:hypothetical protein